MAGRKFVVVYQHGDGNSVNTMTWGKVYDTFQQARERALKAMVKSMAEWSDNDYVISGVYYDNHGELDEVVSGFSAKNVRHNINIKEAYYVLNVKEEEDEEDIE